MGGAAVANDKNLTPEQKDALVGAREAIKERGESFSLPEGPASKFSPSALTMAETGAKFHALPVPPYISEKTIERSVGYSDHPFRSSGTPEVTEALSLRKLYGPAPLGKTPGLADAMKELETLLKEQRESGEKLSPADQMRRANELLMKAREELKEALLSDISKRLSISGSIETENPGIAQKAIEAAKEAAKMQPIVPIRVEEGDRYHVRRAEEWSSPKTIEIIPSE